MPPTVTPDDPWAREEDMVEAFGKKMRSDERQFGQSNGRGLNRDRTASELTERAGGWDDEFQAASALRRDSITWTNRTDKEIWG